MHLSSEETKCASTVRPAAVFSCSFFPFLGALLIGVPSGPSRCARHAPLDLLSFGPVLGRHRLHVSIGRSGGGGRGGDTRPVARRRSSNMSGGLGEGNGRRSGDCELLTGTFPRLRRQLHVQKLRIMPVFGGGGGSAMDGCQRLSTRRGFFIEPVHWCGPLHDGGAAGPGEGWPCYTGWRWGESGNAGIVAPSVRMVCTYVANLHRQGRMKRYEPHARQSSAAVLFVCRTADI